MLSEHLSAVSQVKLKDEDITFALKCIKKKHIVEARQQEHIYSEKNILQQTNSAFIITYVPHAFFLGFFVLQIARCYF